MGVIICGFDKTEHVLLKKNIDEHEINKQLYDVFLQSQVGFAILKGSEFIIELANNPYLEIVDKTPEDFVGKKLFEALPELNNQGIKELLFEVLETGKPLGFSERSVQLKKKGEIQTIYVNFVYQPLRDKFNKVYGIIVIVNDITEQVVSKNRAEESEERFHSLADQAPMFVFMADSEGKVKYWNKEWLIFTGQSFEEALGIDGWQKVTHPDDFEFLLNSYLHAAQNREKYSLEVRLKRCDNEYRYILFTGGPRFLPNGEFEGYVGTGLDITNRKLAEKALEKSEFQFRQMADMMPAKISNADATGNVYYFNHEFVLYTGLTTEELIKNGWQQIVHPEDFEKAELNWSNSIKSGNSFSMELRFLNKEGEYKWHLSQAIPVKDEFQKIEKWIGAATEIHEQKIFSQELEQLVEERIKETFIKNIELQKSNENLEQFASIASHDLQEPLRKIQTFTMLLQKKHRTEISDDANILIDKIKSSSNRMSALIEDVLSFSRITDINTQFVDVDLNLILNNVVEDFELVIKEKKVIINKEVLPKIQGIPFQINQLFYNLISNAIKFENNTHNTIINISSTKIKGKELQHFGDLNEMTSYFLIKLSDNGIGFDQQFSEDIFLIFNRLNDSKLYSGNGIGLALCKKIVDIHKGKIYAESNENEGAVFNIILPEKQM